MTTFGNTDYIPTNVPDIEAVAVTSSASVNHLGAEPGTQVYSGWAIPVGKRKQAYCVIH